MQRSTLIALIILNIVIIWIVSGLFISSDTTEDTRQSLDKGPALVRVETKEALKKTKTISLYGNTEPLRKTTLKAEASGRILTLPAKEGAPISKGTTIATIDVRDRLAQLAEAKSTLRLRQSEYNTAKELHKTGYASETRLLTAKANVDIAKSRLSSIKWEVEHTVIDSPFDGSLETLHVEIGDVVDAGKTDVATLAVRSTVLAVGSLTERQLYDVTLGSQAFATLIDGTVLEGKVRFIGRQADRETRTFRIEIEIPLNGKDVAEGITTEILIPVGEVDAHFLSPSQLALSEKGDIGVKLVNDNDKVEFHAITLLEETTEGVWVIGLPRTIRLITLGHPFVRVGDVVNIGATE